MKNHTRGYATLLTMTMSFSAVTAHGFDSLFASFYELNEAIDQAFSNMHKQAYGLTTKAKKAGAARTADTKKRCTVEEFHENGKFGLTITLPEAYAVEAPTVTIATQKSERGAPSKHIEVVARYVNPQNEALGEADAEALAALEAAWESFIESYFSASWIDDVYTESRTEIVAKDGTITIKRGLPALIDEQQYTLTQKDNAVIIEFAVKKKEPAVSKKVLTFTKKTAEPEKETKKVTTKSAKQELKK